MTGAMTVDEATRSVASVKDRVGEAVVAEESFFETVLTGFLARGHVLLEDIPGTGKTLTAIALADALGLEFNRIQFTPDLLPIDITGSNVFDEHDGSFRFQPGPLFGNVVLADEINRAPPKTQAALLEAMEERQVTVDGETYDLPEPFFVIATQNPIEQEGTFRLPEAQRDRFIVKTSLGYPDRDGELELIDRRSRRHTTMPEVSNVTSTKEVRALREVPETVTVDDRVRGYVVDIARATRRDDRVRIGVSPRGIQRFFEAVRARAVVAGRDYVAPDDVKAAAIPVLNHRLILTSEADLSGAQATAIIEGVLDGLEVPATKPE